MCVLGTLCCLLFEPNYNKSDPSYLHIKFTLLTISIFAPNNNNNNKKTIVYTEFLPRYYKDTTTSLQHAPKFKFEFSG